MCSHSYVDYVDKELRSDFRTLSSDLPNSLMKVTPEPPRSAERYETRRTSPRPAPIDLSRFLFLGISQSLLHFAAFLSSRQWLLQSLLSSSLLLRSKLHSIVLLDRATLRLAFRHQLFSLNRYFPPSIPPHKYEAWRIQMANVRIDTQLMIQRGSGIV